ncbi:hypothetical protein MMC22_003901 [Lobaria immixta]|nr:hypothetical protein [Lobaria immixta]
MNAAGHDATGPGRNSSSMYVTFNEPGFVEYQVDPLSATYDWTYDRRGDQMDFPVAHTISQLGITSQTSRRSGSFNFYAIYPQSRATLTINGDLDLMVEHWIQDEWSARRRIVRFWRNRSGREIHTNLEPVTPDDRPHSSICISCIVWEERRECFVTIVDTIFLLEPLIGIHSTVEEKNLSRENLEWFPNPKPRNIEKDVQVF